MKANNKPLGHHPRELEICLGDYRFLPIKKLSKKSIFSMVKAKSLERKIVVWPVAVAGPPRAGPGL
jgi:hypothetical protein